MINDDMINDFLDGKKEDKDLLNQINKSEEAKNNYDAYKKLDSALLKLEKYELGNNFNITVMAKLKKRLAEQKKQKNVLLAVVIFLGAVCLFFTGLLFAYVLDKTEKVSDSYLSQNTSSIIDKFTYYFKQITFNSSLNVVAPVLAFIILVSAYFFYESRRQSN
ncbi:MAG: hypothetical protein ACM3O3_09145 [Syntrophothermus sp.]